MEIYTILHEFLEEIDFENYDSTELVGSTLTLDEANAYAQAEGFVIPTDVTPTEYEHGAPYPHKDDCRRELIIYRHKVGQLIMPNYE